MNIISLLYPYTTLTHFVPISYTSLSSVSLMYSQLSSSACYQLVCDFTLFFYCCALFLSVEPSIECIYEKILRVPFYWAFNWMHIWENLTCSFLLSLQLNAYMRKSYVFLSLDPSIECIYEKIVRVPFSWPFNWMHIWENLTCSSKHKQPTHLKYSRVVSNFL